VNLSAPDTTNHAETRRDNLRGAAWMTAGMFGYVVNDSLIKLAAEDLPLFQAIFLRGLVVITLLTVIVRVRGARAPLSTYLQRPLLLRIGMEAAGTVAYLITLTKVDIAGLTAVMQLVPIAVTFAAARLLGERVGPHRVAALALGFIGVLFVVRPTGDDFSPWFLGGLVSVALIVIRELATRRISTSVAGTAVALGTGVTITVMGGVISIFEGWQTPQPGTLAQLAAGACFLSLGYVASVNSIRLGDISFSAPFRYTVLVFAIILQIVIFDDVPDVMTFLGAAIVGGAGLYALAYDGRTRGAKGRRRS
jgi:drug/metabolite transporter (DMT)-like permease